MPQKAFEVPHRFADKAIELDSSLAQGYIAKGNAYLYYDWNWKEAFKALQKAIELNPGATEAYESLAFYYIIMGEKAKALELMEEAVRLDPLSTAMNNFLGNVYVFNERYDDAIRQADKLLEMDPTMRTAIELKGWGYGFRNDWREALELFKEVHRLTGHPLKGLMPMRFSIALSMW